MPLSRKNKESQREYGIIYCPRCALYKTIEEFGATSRAYCKECHRIYMQRLRTKRSLAFQAQSDLFKAFDPEQNKPKKKPRTEAQKKQQVKWNQEWNRNNRAEYLKQKREQSARSLIKHGVAYEVMRSIIGPEEMDKIDREVDASIPYPHEIEQEYDQS